MNEGPRRDLRPHLRVEHAPDDSIVVVRGNPTTLAKLAHHARRTHDAYVLDGQPVWGVSVFCALDDIGPSSLSALLQRFASYRAVHLARAGQLRQAGFELLPSFRRPHFTVKAASGDTDELSRLLSAFARRSATLTMAGDQDGGSRGQRRHHL